VECDFVAEGDAKLVVDTVPEMEVLATSTGALVMEDGMIIREGNPPKAKGTKSA